MTVGILKDLFPGIWHFAAITVQGEKDTTFFHPLGRIPDVYELADGGILGPGDVTPASGSEAEIPSTEERPEGSPDWYVIKVTNTTYTVRKWTTGNIDIAANLMIRLGFVETGETL